jgi:hypothetical protein
MKARSAIGLAGHGGDTCSGSTLEVETSTAFTPTPTPFIPAVHGENQVISAYGQV